MWDKPNSIFATKFDGKKPIWLKKRQNGGCMDGEYMQLFMYKILYTFWWNIWSEN